MKRAIIAFLGIVLIQFLLAGCWREPMENERPNDEVQRQCAKIEKGILRHRAAMRRGSGNPIGCGDELVKEIKRLTDRDLKRKYIEQWADDVYSFDLDALHYDATGHGLSVWKQIKKFTETVMWQWAESYDEGWNAYLRYFSWCREQLGKMKNKRPYPKGAKPVWTRSGDVHWEIEDGSRKDYLEFAWWLENYNNFTAEYENTLTTKEAKFSSACELMSQSEAITVRNKFEQFLGRKVRTTEQWRNDWRAQRRYEFPAYVATPEGIRECWTKAEEEAAKKRAK